MTTVEDLLRWNRNFDEPVVADRSFVAAEQEPGTVSDGTPHRYAFGLAIGRYKGFREVGHDGATAGYSADLSRFPDRRLSVAVLFNADAADASGFAHEVADLFLADQSHTDNREVPSYTLTPAEASRATGLYRNAETGVPMRLVATGSGIRSDHGPALTTVDAAFRLGDVRFELSPTGPLRVVDSNGRTVVFERRSPVTTTIGQLASLRGTYISDEADSVVIVRATGAQLEMTRRAATVLPLIPLWQNAFSNAALGTSCSDATGTNASPHSA